jgi:very-short-patch-repair endonuclease
MEARRRESLRPVQSSAPFGPPARPRLVLADVAGRVACLAPGGRLTVIGLGADRLMDILDPARGALLLAADGLQGAGAILDRLLDDLAELALLRWPDRYGGDAPGETADPRISGPWRRAAVKRVGQGRPPRFRRAARELELAQLLLAIDPAGLILVAEIDSASPVRAGPVIEALGWCAGAGATIVAALPAAPPDTPPYDRILYGAVAIERETAPLAARFVPPPLPPSSRAHPASAVERRVEAALARDAELAGLFSGNEAVTVPGHESRVRVDLLCRAHRVVVELDGPEHRAPAVFEADRHRDYALLAAGYLVLRLTNRQVETDLARAIEKIRDVVRLRRPCGETPSR